jgi:hypothetical protein
MQTDLVRFGARDYDAVTGRWTLKDYVRGYRMSHPSAVLSAVVSERLAQLSAKSFDELVLLQNQASEELIRDGYKLRVTVWHDMLASGEHRIVVQAGKRGMLASWRFHAEGFVIKNRHERRALTEEERSPFS